MKLHLYHSQLRPTLAPSQSYAHDMRAHPLVCLLKREHSLLPCLEHLNTAPHLDPEQPRLGVLEAQQVAGLEVPVDDGRVVRVQVLHPTRHVLRHRQPPQPPQSLRHVTQNTSVKRFKIGLTLGPCRVSKCTEA